MKKILRFIIPVCLGLLAVYIWSMNQSRQASDLLYGETYQIETKSGSSVQSSQYSGFLSNHRLSRVVFHPAQDPDDYSYHVVITTADKPTVEVWCYSEYVKINQKWYAEDLDFLADVSELYRDMLFDQTGQE